MADSDNLELRVKELLRDHLAIEVPGPDADLVAMGALDSLALVEMLVKIEEQLGISISIEEVDLSDLRSVRSISALLARRLVPR